MLRDALTRVADEYVYARGRKFAGDTLATFIRQDLAEEARQVLPSDFNDLLVKGSAGQGTWAAVPWLAFFDPMVTTSATQEYYVVYLYDAQAEDLYLSLNQGTTAVVREFGETRGREVLRERAHLIRSRLSDISSDYSAAPIDLRSPANLPRGYEAGHAFGFSYDAHDLPDEETLVAHLIRLLTAYRTLVFRGGLSLSEAILEDSGTQEIAEARRYQMSRRLERRRSVRRDVLRHNGVVCEGCGLDPALHYGLGGIVPPLNMPVDVHHLRPLSEIEEGRQVRYRIPDDFAVLCPSCHRVAHLLDDPGDIAALRRRVRFRHMTELL